MLRGEKRRMTMMNGRIFSSRLSVVKLTSQIILDGRLVINTQRFFFLSSFSVPLSHTGRFEYAADRIARHLPNKVGNNLIVSDMARSERAELLHSQLCFALCKDLYAYLQVFWDFCYDSDV